MTGLGLFLLVMAVGAFYMYSRGEKKAAPALPTTFSPLKIGLNDVFTHMDREYLVEGILTYSEDGDHWWEFRLVDGDTERYLCVEDDDELELTLWEEIDMPIPLQGPDEEVEWEGQRYRAVEKGTARVSRIGMTGRKTGLSCDYFEYKGSAGSLAIEKWGGRWEAHIGTEILPGSYDHLGGGGDLVKV